MSVVHLALSSSKLYDIIDNRPQTFSRVIIFKDRGPRLFVQSCRFVELGDLRRRTMNQVIHPSSCAGILHLPLYLVRSKAHLLER